MLSPRRMRARRGAMRDTARELLAGLGEGPVDLMADFTTRYPLAVVGDLLGVPRAMLDDAVEACRRMFGDEADVAAAMGGFARLAATAMQHEGLARELRERLPADVTDEQVHYLLFTLLFAGQLTTGAALGFLLARVLTEGPPATPPPSSTTSCAATRPRRSRSGGSPPRRSSSRASSSRRGPRCSSTSRGRPTTPTRAPARASRSARARTSARPSTSPAPSSSRSSTSSSPTSPTPASRCPPTDLRRVDPGGIAGSRLAALPVEGLRPRERSGSS